jgi:hypothetical protein
LGVVLTTPHPVKKIVTKPKRKISRTDLLERPRHGNFNFATWNVRWLDDVEENLRMMRISGWRVKVWRRDEWKSVLREVKVLQGP